MSVLRLLRPLLVLASVLGLVAATSATASAVPATPTTIFVAIVTDLAPPVAGRPTDLTAVLGDDTGTPVAGQLLTLSVQTAGSADFQVVGQATTDASGRATVWATLDHDVVARWSYDGNTTYGASTSADYGVQVAPLVTARAHDRTLRRGQRLLVTGRTTPVKAGCAVSLWRGVPRPLTSGPAPKLLARSVARADGSYRLVRRLHRAARLRVAVTVASCAGNARGLSHAIAIRVR